MSVRNGGARHVPAGSCAGAVMGRGDAKLAVEASARVKDAPVGRLKLPVEYHTHIGDKFRYGYDVAP